MQKTSITEMHRLTVDEFHKARKLPLVVVMDNVRSLYNIGSVFRTADAFLLQGVVLCGISAVPLTVAAEDDGREKECTMKASQELHKTALGAEESVSWRYFSDTAAAVAALKREGYTVMAVEQAHGATLLPHFRADFSTRKYAVVLGNEVKGVRQDVVDQCDGCLEIPQYGTKHSLNVSVTAGIVIAHFAL